ncbi:type II secretion system protein A [Cognatiyoonia koreensis]|uniref:Type II secretion system protein A n=1 Tax=Cognatiyoonia koreensis TaxID=364200 RepID=A0A1I0RSI4_9RHOB|nr:AAA family ATPase [Cognatiyoonia koreensis]SEW44247.1 type II secretion system protein A [Cognatiyoonia koreensis]
MSADLYCEFFGFSERPFTLSPDPDMLFWTRDHKRAYSILEYGLMTRAPLTVVTGEVGTGKTTLVQALLRSIEDDVVIGLISNAQGGRDDLLRWVLNALDLAPTAQQTYVELFQQFQDFVINSYAEGKRVILIFDEAQNLGAETLEELRMLTNINSGKDELLQLILVGQPELRTIIMQPELSQFAQRVTSTYHLNPLDRKTTHAYIQHRLKAVGGTGDEISRDAIDMICDKSSGIPRVINKICDLALVYASGEEHKVVSVETISELVRDGVIMQTFTGPLILFKHAQDTGKAAE